MACIYFVYTKDSNQFSYLNSIENIGSNFSSKAIKLKSQNHLSGNQCLNLVKIYNLVNIYLVMVLLKIYDCDANAK